MGASEDRLKALAVDAASGQRDIALPAALIEQRWLKSFPAGVHRLNMPVIFQKTNPTRSSPHSD
jgi:hypothetical protein